MKIILNKKQILHLFSGGDFEVYSGKKQVWYSPEKNKLGDGYDAQSFSKKELIELKKDGWLDAGIRIQAKIGLTKKVI